MLVFHSTVHTQVYNAVKHVLKEKSFKYKSKAFILNVNQMFSLQKNKKIGHMAYIWHKAFPQNEPHKALTFSAFPALYLENRPKTYVFLKLAFLK